MLSMRALVRLDLSHLQCGCAERLTIREKWKPRSKILQIESMGKPRRNVSTDFFTDSHPKKLIEHIKDLLNRNPAGS